MLLSLLVLSPDTAFCTAFFFNLLSHSSLLQKRMKLMNEKLVEVNTKTMISRLAQRALVQQLAKARRALANIEQEMKEVQREV